MNDEWEWEEDKATAKSPAVSKTSDSKTPTETSKLSEPPKPVAEASKMSRTSEAAKTAVVSKDKELKDKNKVHGLGNVLGTGR